MTEQLSDGLPTRGLRLLYYKVNALYNRIRCLVNKLFRLDYLTSKYEKLHVGCRSEEHTSELQSHSFISYAVFCLKKKNKKKKYKDKTILNGYHSH